MDIDMDMELSDDVSALSMDGASAIAESGFARRLRKDFAEMKLSIPEDEEQEQEAGGVADRESPAAPHKENRTDRTNGEELIEPFPKTFEEWQKKKQRRQKHKGKKHSKKSSKEGGEGRRSNKSKSKHKEQQDQQQQQQPQQQQECVNQITAPPVMEISIQATNFRPPRSEHASDARSYPSSTASPSQRGSLLSGSVEATSRGQSVDHPSSFVTDKTENSTRSLQYQQSCQSIDRQVSTAERTDNSTHATGRSSAHSQSNVTVEDLQILRISLDKVKMEEKQVLKIHQRLETEVQWVKDKSVRVMTHQRAVSNELQLAESKRQKLQRKLKEVQDENVRLRSTVRTMDEKKSDEVVDDMLDSMGAKLRALKAQSRKAKQRKETRP